MLQCTLCNNIELDQLAPEGDQRIYYYCPRCKLIFTDPKYFPSREKETARYLEHNNGITDPGYVRFLNQVIEPALPYLTPAMTGLDYGCGPEPTLSRLLADHGMQCHDYDPLFGFDHPLSTYDFIFSTECFEHFHEPGRELQKIDTLLLPGSYLVVMTERWESFERFHSWYYKRDFTHVSFFHLDTFRFISDQMHYNIEYFDRNRIVIFEKL